MADQDYKCGNCFYFRDDQIMGVCRYLPQQVNKHTTDWCGQHKPFQPVVIPLPVVDTDNWVKIEKVVDEVIADQVKPKRKYTRKKKA